jgi:hypothetical protein
MKVDGGNGKFYTRDHPKEIISDKVMRFEVIRNWMRILSTDPAYGWVPGGLDGLSRALGMGTGGVKRKLSTAWIWPREQVRFTARINEIIDGYIVPKRFGRRVDGVYTDPPKPPNVKVPRRLILQAQVGGLRVLTAPRSAPPQMPAFKDAFKDVSFWNPDRK